MLEYLRIRNLALIDDMELEFAPGMNVLTGETGAGKSFILKALNFLMGDRLGADMVRPGHEKAQVEALFVLPETELVLRRDLVAETGRSRLYINDNLGSQESLKELRPTLIMHTSQFGQQKLLQPAYQAKLIDDWMEQPELLQTKDNLCKKMREAINHTQGLQQKFQELADKRELLEMHLKEISKVNPLLGEEDELEELRKKMRESEHLKQAYTNAKHILRTQDPSLLDSLGSLEKILEVLSKVDESMNPYLDLTMQYRQTIQDFEQHLRKTPFVQTEMDSEAIESRLFALSQLKRKLHRTLPEILALKDEIEGNLSFLDACSLDIKQAHKQELQLGSELQACLQNLNQARQVASQSFTQKLKTSLEVLGFSQHVQVAAEVYPVELFPNCEELRIRLLWAPNPGQQPQPLDRIASGGELARFLLAVVSIQTHFESATLIFDEVDAGVGGVTLNRVAERLEELAKHRQMLLITHWPQLAGRANRHFQVIKEIHNQETFTQCKQLSTAQRELELSRMAGIE